MRGRLKLLQMRDSQAKTFQISFLTAQEEAEFLIPPHFQHSELLLWLRRALQKGLGWKMTRLGLLSRTEARKEPASHTPGTRKDVIFTPEGALCLGKLRRTANFPGSFRISPSQLVQVRVNLQPHRAQRGFWHQIHQGRGSLTLIYSWVLGFFQTASHWEFFVITWLSDSVRFWK